jgi:hypothetical protein
MARKKHPFEGTDKDLETSLFEYGIISRKHDGDYDDEYFVIYQLPSFVGEKVRFDYAYKQESELNALIKGEDWVDHEEVKNFLDTHGIVAEDWFKLSFPSKLYDLVYYFGVLNILGACYSDGMTKGEVMRKYIRPEQRRQAKQVN